MTSSITAISGIGVSTAETLASHGIKTVKDLAKASIEQITRVPGFSHARASKAKAGAANLLGGDQTSTPEGKRAPASKRTKRRKAPVAAAKKTTNVLEEVVKAAQEAGEAVDEALADPEQDSPKPIAASAEGNRKKAKQSGKKGSKKNKGKKKGKKKKGRKKKGKKKN